MERNKREKGSRYEEQAAAFLEERGVRILERNFRCRQGEIDLVGNKDDTLIFFEVKYRKNDVYGSPSEAVDIRKQNKICRAADLYCMKNNLCEDKAVRFDVIAVLGREITWYRDAFAYREVR